MYLYLYLCEQNNGGIQENGGWEGTQLNVRSAGTDSISPPLYSSILSTQQTQWHKIQSFRYEYKLQSTILGKCWLSAPRPKQNPARIGTRMLPSSKMKMNSKRELHQLYSQFVRIWKSGEKAKLNLRSENGFIVGACFFCFCNFFLCHPQDVLELYFLVYIYICNSVFYATESTGSTRCWNIKEGRWNQCRLT